MQSNQVQDPFDLLGQTEKSAAPVYLPGDITPQLKVGWGEFRQSLGSSISSVVSGPPASRKFVPSKIFKDSWIEGRIPRRAVIAAALWHFVFIFMPFPNLPAAPKKFDQFADSQLYWSGPINDLPLLDMPGEKPKASPNGEPNKPLAPKGADAFHPRQRIFTDPAHPTHPRQTLINRAAPPIAPKLMPNLPNMVQLPSIAGPARPRLEISEKTLATLHPRERRAATSTVTPPTDVPSLDPHLAEMTLAPATNGPARPHMQINAGSAPRAAERKQNGDVGPAPEVGSQVSAANGNQATLIALSNTPGPVAPVQPPAGNTSARVSISPEGKTPGVPGGTPNAPPSNGNANGNAESKGGTGNSGAGKHSVGVSISGGNPPTKSGVSGLGGTPPSKLTMPAARPLASRPEPHSDEPQERKGPPDFSTLPPDAKPEQIFATKKVYTLNVNMPNMNSSTGSWILHFSELRNNPNGPHVMSPELAGPAPIKKVDPRYPPSLIGERVEGEVILYAVIRRDGSVDSIKLVKGIDEQLDENAMQALGQWKFHPAEKEGEPVELEAIVHIPFHLPASFRN